MATLKTGWNWRRRLASERAELIEFALVFPLLLMVVLGIVDFGFLFQRMEVVTNAAREGARIACVPRVRDGRRYSSRHKLHPNGWGADHGNESNVIQVTTCRSPRAPADRI